MVRVTDITVLGLIIWTLSLDPTTFSVINVNDVQHRIHVMDGEIHALYYSNTRRTS